MWGFFLYGFWFDRLCFWRVVVKRYDDVCVWLCVFGCVWYVGDILWVYLWCIESCIMGVFLCSYDWVFWILSCDEVFVLFFCLLILLFVLICGLNCFFMGFVCWFLEVEVLFWSRIFVLWICFKVWNILSWVDDGNFLNFVERFFFWWINSLCWCLEVGLYFLGFFEGE